MSIRTPTTRTPGSTAKPLEAPATPVATTATTAIPSGDKKPAAPATPVSNAPMGALIKPRLDKAPVQRRRLNTAEVAKAKAQVGAARVSAGGGAARPSATAPQTQLQKDIKADPAKAAAQLSQMSRTDMMETLKGLTKPEVQQLAEAARAGQGSHEMAMGVSIELAARTNWARTHGENIDHARAQFTRNELQMVADPDGNPGTKNDLAFTQGRNTNISTSLARNPEVLATTIMHENVHATRNGRGEKMPLLQDETEAHVVEAQLWGELRPSGANASDSLIKDMDMTRQRYVDGGEAGLKAYVASSYAFSASKTDPKLLHDMMDGLMADPKARAALTGDDVTKLTLAAGNAATEARRGVPKEQWALAFAPELARLANAIQGSGQGDHAVQVMEDMFKHNAAEMLRKFNANVDN